MRLRALLVALVVATSLASCSSSGRLSDSEIDRACALANRCSGTSSAVCVRAVLNAREIADANGCASLFAETNRCYLSHNACTATARCETLSNQLLACGTATTDVGQADAGRSDAGSCPTGFADLVFVNVRGNCGFEDRAYFFSNGLMHYLNGQPLSCGSCFECTLEQTSPPSCAVRFEEPGTCHGDSVTSIRSYTISPEGVVEGTITRAGASNCEATFYGVIQ